MDNFKSWWDYIGFSRNTATKLASLILAIVLWIYVMDIENPEIVRSFDNVPISLINIERVEANGLLLANPTDLSVNIKLKGRRSELLNLALKDIVVTADLYGANKGYNSIPLNFRINNENVYMTNASRNDLNLYLDKIVEIPKMVEIVVVGELPAGYSQGLVEVLPQEVIVRGPERLVNEVSRLVGSLDITNLKKDLLKEIPIIAVDNDGNAVQGVEIRTPYVSAGIGILRSVDYPIVISVAGEVPEGYKVTAIKTTPERITLTGKEDQLLTFTELMVGPIDVSDQVESYTFEMPLKLATGLVSEEALTAVQVEVTIEKVITATFGYDFNDISFLNLENGVTVEDQVVDIVVKAQGVESVINGLKKEDIALLVDLKDLSTGFHLVPLVLKTTAETSLLEANYVNLNIQLIE